MKEGSPISHVTGCTKRMQTGSCNINCLNQFANHANFGGPEKSTHSRLLVVDNSNYNNVLAFLQALNFLPDLSRKICGPNLNFTCGCGRLRCHLCSFWLFFLPTFLPVSYLCSALFIFLFPFLVLACPFYNCSFSFISEVAPIHHHLGCGRIKCMQNHVENVGVWGQTLST